MMVDGDAVYPPDYVARVKRLIESGLYPQGFKATRGGGFSSSSALEAGMVVPRALFLERTSRFVPSGSYVDVGPLFVEQPVSPDVTYQHGLTSGEKGVLVFLGLAAAGGALLFLASRGLAI